MPELSFRSLSAEVVVHDAFGFNATELRRADHEVHDIADGRMTGEYRSTSKNLRDR